MPIRPMNIRVTGAAPPPPAGNVLSPSQITYLGAIRMPTIDVDTRFNYGGMSGRKVGANLRMFVTGNVVASGNNPPDLYELDITGLTPNPVIASAPRATLHRNWGDIYHGKRQSWDANPPYAEQSLLGQAALNHGLYWHEGLQQIFWAYCFQYVSVAPWTVAFSTLNDSDGSSVAYGPFKFAATDSVATRLGGRAHWFAMHPTTGKLLMGGVIKGGAAQLSYGPSLYGDNDWPTPATTSGQFMPAIVQGSKYLTYYYSNFPSHGEPNNPLRSFKYDGVITYPFEYAPAQASVRVNPVLNGGIGTWSDNDGVEAGYWFEGVNRRGVMFFGTLQAGRSANPADATAAHYYYNNQGQVGMDLSNRVGTFISGETIIGSALGYTANTYGIDNDTPAVHAQQGSPWTQDYQIGETITGQTSGATATVVTFRRNSPTCAHGFAPATPGSTGPVTTKSVPVILIFDPAKLEAVKAGSVTDYAQLADYIIDVEYTYGVVTGAQNVPGGAKALAGYYFDTATNRLYLNANRADITRGIYEELIHVFQISDV